MSDSLPYSGVEIVAVMRYAVVTHAWTLRPCRSSPMVRIADVTMVWSSAARNMPSIRPPSTCTIWRWLNCDDPGGATVVLLILTPSSTPLGLPTNDASTQTVPGVQECAISQRPRCLLGNFAVCAVAGAGGHRGVGAQRRG